MDEVSTTQSIQIAAAHHRAGRLAEARAIYQQILAREPNHPDALHLLGVTAIQSGQTDAAIELIRRAIAINPGAADYHNNLGYALRNKGQLDESIAAWREAIRLRPDFVMAYNNLGMALRIKGQLDEAILAYRQALQLKPDLAEIHSNLGSALRDKRQFDEALASYRQAIALRPEFAKAYSNMGIALKREGRLDEAIAAYRQAIGIKPDYAEAISNLGNALKDTGQLDEAIAAFRQAVQLRPDYAAAHSNLIFTLHFHAGCDVRMIDEEHRRWNRQFAEPLTKLIQPHTNDRDPDRPLRIGYVSPDLYDHSVGRFLVPLLAAHDAGHFDVFCYANVQHPDGLTELLRRHADQWKNTIGLTDEKIAQLIRADQIDILVDLTMHTANNRILVFARKPAPVQVTYLAYCSTTGLDTMDYRLTDPYLDPPGMNDAFYCEQSIRLPRTYWCYSPDDQSPEVGPLPALSAGEVTFGCLNNFCKVSPESLNLWIQLLRVMPKSRLILHAHEGSHRQRVWNILEHHGIDPRCLNFVGSVVRPRYFKQYQQIDIGLDPFPYNGGTTTCDALWMGVPVITLRGQTAVGRGGVSILSNVGLTDWIADNPERYISIAQQMAGDLPKLAELRSTLRQRMLASPLMDDKQFARDVEAAFRRMWMNWCSKQPGQK